MLRAVGWSWCAGCLTQNRVCPRCSAALLTTWCTHWTARRRYCVQTRRSPHGKEPAAPHELRSLFVVIGPLDSPRYSPRLAPPVHLPQFSLSPSSHFPDASTCHLADSTTIPAASLHFLQSIMRRLFRIFSHSYFHHREVFDRFEAEHRLCKRFVSFSNAHNLMSKDQLIIPEEAYT